MPTKKKNQPEEQSEGALISAAKKIGAAAGKIAVMTGLEKPASAPAKKRGKLAKSTKSRVPRKQKKAQKKAAAKSQKG